MAEKVLNMIKDPIGSRFEKKKKRYPFARCSKPVESMITAAAQPMASASKSSRPLKAQAMVTSKTRAKRPLLKSFKHLYRWLEYVQLTLVLFYICQRQDLERTRHQTPSSLGTMPFGLS